ncbi:hypothetical protein Hdeb2414_s0090g00787701 [Helianthus debilis subsp. tardiflorus]
MAHPMNPSAIIQVHLGLKSVEMKLRIGATGLEIERWGVYEKNQLLLWKN